MATKNVRKSASTPVVSPVPAKCGSTPSADCKMAECGTDLTDSLSTRRGGMAPVSEVEVKEYRSDVEIDVDGDDLGSSLDAIRVKLIRLHAKVGILEQVLGPVIAPGDCQGPVSYASTEARTPLGSSLLVINDELASLERTLDCITSRLPRF